MLAEERNNRLHEIATPRHDVLAQVLLVVVMPTVHDKPPHPEELSEIFEALRAFRALGHNEPMAHLKSGSVAASANAIVLTHEADREAAFSVYETDHPTTELGQSFLLIVRTRHVVTIVNARSDGTMSSAGYSGFPAYSQMRTATLP